MGAGVEAIGKRTKDARHFRRADGTWTAVLGHDLNADDGTGHLAPVLPSLWRSGQGWTYLAGPITVRIPPSKQGHDVRYSYSGPESKPHMIKLGFPNLTHVSDTSFGFTLGTLPWKLTVREHGSEFSAVVNSAVGSRAYAFGVDAQGTTLTVSKAGDLIADDGAVVTRAKMIRADHAVTDCSAWLLNGNTASFSCDDTGFPKAAFPYTIDPNLQAPLSGVAYCGGSSVGSRPTVCNQGGQVLLGISEQIWNDANNNVNVNNFEQDYAFDTSSIPSGAAVSSATLGFPTASVSFNTNGNACYLKTYSSGWSFPVFLGQNTNTPDVINYSRIDNVWTANQTYNFSIPTSSVVKGGRSGYVSQMRCSSEIVTNSTPSVYGFVYLGSGTLTVNYQAVSITTTSLPNGTGGTAYSQTLAATGGNAPYAWNVISGSLPNGLTLSSAGVLSGTPASTGTYNFTVQVTDSTSGSQATATQVLQLIINPGSGGGPDWYNHSWLYRKAITIAHGQVSGSSALSNFPVLISLTDSNLASAAQASGNDILFTDSSGLTKVPHEIEQYTSSSGQVLAWVQVPSLSPTADTVIYLYYGNSTAPDQSNRTGVWDSNYKGVYHLANGTTLSGGDSTGYANSGSLQGGPTALAGEIDGAGSFSGSSQNLSLGNASSLQIIGQISLEAWVNVTAFPSSGWGYLIGKGYDGINEGYFLRLSNSGSIVTEAGSYNGSNHSTSWAVSGWNTGTWHHVVGVFDGANWILYFDGSSKAQASDSTGALSTTKGVYFGATDIAGSVSRYFNGKLDEVRISNMARSASWIQTEYNNQSYPTTFYSVGPEQTSASGNAIPATLVTTPPGLAVMVDSASCTTPCTYQWTPGGTHTIAVASPQAGGTGTQYSYASWSDSGAQSHTVTAPSSAVTYTANFSTQYYLTTTLSTQGVISPVSGWYANGSVVQVSATAYSGFTFTGFTGALSGTATPQNVTMSGPRSVTAGFTQNAWICVTSLPGGVVGQPYSIGLVACSGTPPYNWSLISGSLPPGLTLSGATIYGTPATAGTYTFTVKLTDSTAPTPQTATQQLSITIVGALSITTSSLANGTTGVVYLQTLDAAGGIQPYGWAVSSGTLPPGVTLSSAGTLSGSPTAIGTYTFTVQVNDSSAPAQMAARTFSVTISAALAITTTSLPSATVNTAYTQTLAATGGTLPYTWAVIGNTLPPGLALNATTGNISGTPSTAGAYNFTVQVTDSTSAAKTQALSITVSTTGSNWYNSAWPYRKPITIAHGQVSGSSNCRTSRC